MLRFSIIKGFALAAGDDVARHATVIRRRRRRKRRLVNISFIIADRERERNERRERDLMDMMMTDLMTNANAAGEERTAVKYQIKNSSLAAAARIQGDSECYSID